MDRALCTIAAHFKKKQKNKQKKHPRVGGGRKELMEEPEFDQHSKGITIKRDGKISHTIKGNR